MRNKIAFILGTLVLIVGVCWATSVVYTAPDTHSRSMNKYETLPGAVPATATDPFASLALGNVWLDTATFTNTNTSNCLLTIVDQQPTPQVVLQAVLPAYAAANPTANNYIVWFHDRLAVGGIKWSACDGSSVTGYIRVEK